MDISTTAILAAAIGGISGGIISFVSGILNNRAERKRHIREIAVQAGLEAYRAQFEAMKISGRSANIRSPDYYILYSARMAELLDGLPNCPDKIRERLTQLTEFEAILNSDALDVTRKRAAAKEADGREN